MQSVDLLSYIDNKSLGTVSRFSISVILLRLHVCAPILVPPPPTTLRIISIWRSVLLFIHWLMVDLKQLGSAIHLKESPNVQMRNCFAVLGDFFLSERRTDTQECFIGGECRVQTNINIRFVYFGVRFGLNNERNSTICTDGRRKQSVRYSRFVVINCA